MQEVIQGLRQDPASEAFQDALLALPILSDPLPSAAFLSAAEIYRLGRAKGYTVRSSTDCLIAAIAIDNGVAVWHRTGTLKPSRGIRAFAPEPSGKSRVLWLRASAASSTLRQEGSPRAGEGIRRIPEPVGRRRRRRKGWPVETATEFFKKRAPETPREPG